ncbi:MAG TPA: alpha/beta hydrolase [Gammaproteobacteria bacterium]|nr:alpha/beta hydrolase [Gammaproteobacteria bacterium]
MPYATSYRLNQSVQIYYEDIGELSSPIVVMQHGDGNDSQNWKSLGYVEKLLPYVRLILIDYLGYGQSEKIYDPNAYTMPLLSSDTIAVLNHINVNTEVTFFGGSMGARVGYELATTKEYAKYFNKFIINGMVASHFDIVTEFAKWVDMGGMPYVAEQMEKTFMVEPFPKAIRETFLNNDPAAYRAANLNPWPSITDKLHLIDKPVLLICGEKAGERADMEQSAALIKQAQLKIIPKLDHAQAYWYAHEVVPLILDFILDIVSTEL